MIEMPHAQLQPMLDVVNAARRWTALELSHRDPGWPDDVVRQRYAEQSEAEDSLIEAVARLEGFAVQHSGEQA